MIGAVPVLCGGRPLVGSGRLQAMPSRPTRMVAASAAKGPFFVGGNWKANSTTSSVKQLVEELNQGRSLRRWGITLSSDG